MKKLIVFSMLFGVLKGIFAQGLLTLDSITTYGDDGYDIYFKKYEFQYTVAGDLQTYIEYELGLPDHERVFEKKIEYNYSEDRLTKKIRPYYWSTALNNWRGYSAETKVYNSQNQLLIDTGYSYNDSTATLELSSKSMYYYDEQGNEIKQVFYDYNTELDSMELFWVFENRYDYELDSASRIVKQRDYIQNSTSKEWELAKIHTYSYTDNQIQRIDSTYRNLKWYLDFDITVFDDDGNVIAEENYNWINNVWKLVVKFEYEYDSFGNLLTHSYSRVSLVDTFTLEKVEEFVYIYDYEVEASQIHLPFSEFQHQLHDVQHKSFHKLDSVLYYGYEDNEVSVVGEVVYHYSFLKTAISDEAKKVVFGLFPNPVVDSFSIQYPFDELCWLSIYNSEGIRVFESQVSSKEELTTEYLEKGMYFYALHTSNQVYSGKFLKL